MNYSKLVLVGFISAFVAILTSVLGVAGTVIGSVISSVLYNMLSEALEKPVSDVTIKHTFEWDVAYVFPIIVIALIQLLLICSFLAEWGILPSTFLNVYLSLQDFANNNLYRILGLALLVISVYPLILKPDNVKKVHGVIIAVIGLIFLARGFVDIGNAITDLYHPIFSYFDFPIAVISLILLVIVITRILMSAWQSDHDADSLSSDWGEGTFDDSPHYMEKDNYNHSGKVVRVKKRSSQDSSYNKKVNHNQSVRKSTSPKSRVNKFSKTLSNEEIIYKDSSENISSSDSRINKSSKNIQFESNDLLDEYKK